MAAAIFGPVRGDVHENLMGRADAVFLYSKEGKLLMRRGALTRDTFLNDTVGNAFLRLGQNLLMGMHHAHLDIV